MVTEGRHMPTHKPRLQITLPPDLYETFRRLAAFERRPMAKVITELLVEIAPILQATVAALDQVQKAKGNPATALATAVTRMQGAVEQLAERATGQLDLLRVDTRAAPDSRSGAERTAPRAKRTRKAVKGRKRARA